MPLNRDCLGRRYGPETFAVEAEQVQRYLEATLEPQRGQDDATLSVPAAFAFVPCWPVILRALGDPDLGNAPNQIIHGEQRMEFHRSLRVGDVVATLGTVTSIVPKGTNELYVLELETRDARTGELIVRQENVCISLGSSPAPASPRPKPARAMANPERPQATRTRMVVLPGDITHAYAEASGDRNAIHLDPDAAIASGFPGIIVHGMCLLAIAAQNAVWPHGYESHDGHEVKQLSVRFASPIQPDEQLHLSYWDHGSDCEFEAYAGDGRRVLTNGKVGL